MPQREPKLPIIRARENVFLTPLIPANRLDRVSEPLLSRMFSNILYPQLEKVAGCELTMTDRSPVYLAAGEKSEPVPGKADWSVGVLFEKAERGGNLYVPSQRFSTREVPAGWGVFVRGRETIGLSRVKSGACSWLLLEFGHQEVNAGGVDPQETAERLAA